MATITLLLHGQQTGWLENELDMMYVTAASAGFSSLIGLLVYSHKVRFALRFPFSLFKRMVRFGFAQFGSAATMGFLAQGDVLFLGLFVGNPAVSATMMPQRNSSAGSKVCGMLEHSLSTLAVARLSAQHRSDELNVLIEKMIAFMGIIILPVVLLVWILPIEAVFHWIFKGKYLLAPQLFRLLSLAALAIPFSMNSYILLGMSQVRRLLMATASAVAIFTIVSLILVPKIGVQGQAIAVVASFWMLGLSSTVMVRKLTGLSVRRVVGRWHDAREFTARLFRRIGSGGS